ncbi:MAG: hypothetical protein NC483_02205 [Ruminococcus sp.]|nr:hypothetical protein [Ruminococcus sp.]
MKKFIVIEVGSTNTKAYLYFNNEITNIAYQTIEFKNNYKKENKLNKKDKETLINFINNLEEENIYVYGTSIFRNLNNKEKEEWLKEFKDKTGIEFQIVTPDMENEFTVYGAIAGVDYKGHIAVMIGGGGSTELSIVENGKIIEKANSSFGAMDITDLFPDLKSDYATTDFNKMLLKTKELVNIPKNKADLLILAGGDYIYFYEELNYTIEKNKFYENSLQPYCLNISDMDKLDYNFFYEVSLEDVCIRTNNDAWWRGARGMRLCVKALCDILDVKYIIPTRINMVYGIVEKLKG